MFDEAKSGRDMTKTLTARIVNDVEMNVQIAKYDDLTGICYDSLNDIAEFVEESIVGIPG